MKKRLYIIFLLLAIILYTLLFPRPLKKETVFRPVWSTPLESFISEDISSEKFPFKMNDEIGNPFLGYIRDDGALLLREPVYHRAAISKEGFINYNSLGGTLILQEPSGRVITACETDGFPLLIKNWFLIVSRDRKGISSYSWEGDLLWKYHFGSIITDIDADGNGLLLGFMNGDVALLNQEGETVFTQVHRERVVYGCVLSPIKGGFAVVSGLSPQHLTLYTFEGGDVNLLWECALPDEYRTSRTLGFTRDNRYIFLESAAGLTLYNLLGDEWREIPLPGDFNAGVLQGEGELTSVFSSGPDSSLLQIMELDGGFSLTEPFPRDGGIVFIDSSFIIASGRGRIFKIAREEH